MRKEIRFTLNGEPVSAQVAPHETLVEVLRAEFGLHGARESCGQGMCGCCTVLVNARAVSGCLYLASLCENADIRTIEDGAELDAVQQAFVDAGALQCGFCTPGMLTTAHALLTDEPDADRQRIREVLSGNLCRCTGYIAIVEAVYEARVAYQVTKDTA